jgi:hypothetical protein
MSAAAELAVEATQVAVRSLWRQWGIVNPAVVTANSSEARCVVDPEVLVLASEALVPDERRFVDLVGWLAHRASGLLSVQRMKTLIELAPRAQWHAPTFGHWAVHRAGDRRWKIFAGTAPTDAPRTGKGPEQPNLASPAALSLRLRAAFGVGVKADVATILLCLNGEGRNAAEIASAIGYTDKTVRIAARDLVLSGLIEEFDEYPVTYGVRPGGATALLELFYAKPTQVPEWCPWYRIYAFLIELSRWRKDAKLQASQYLASSRARDLFGEYESTFRSCQLRMPRPEAYRGEAYLDPFREFIGSLGTWLENTGDV